MLTSKTALCICDSYHFLTFSYGRFVRASQSFNALSYDDKILDGFYDICATGDEATLSTIPSLMELQALPFSHGAKTEAVLVNKTLDSELVALEQKALIMTVEIRSKNSEFVGCTLVQTLANLVSNYMGGPVIDPESMLLKYRKMSSALRADTRSCRANTVKGLQSWSQKKVGHVNSQLGLAREVLHMLEIAQDARSLSN